jgi:hypothetical protein
LPAAPSARRSSPLSGAAAGEFRDQIRDRRLGERGQLNAGLGIDGPAQGKEVLAMRDWPGQPDKQQRHLAGSPGEPPPELDAGRVRPLEVIDDQGDRPRRGLVDGQRDELLGEHRGHVGAPIGGDLAAQQPGDGGPPGVRRWPPHGEGVEERRQRDLLAELVARAPEDLTRPGRQVGEGGTDEGGLADARLTLDKHRVAAAPGELS